MIMSLVRVEHNLEEMFWSASLERGHFKDVSSGREKRIKSF